MHTMNLDLEIDPQRLKQYRLDRDLTLERMAKLLKLSTSTIWKIENGVVKPQERIAARILRTIPELRRTE